MLDGGSDACGKAAGSQSAERLDRVEAGAYNGFKPPAQGKAVPRNEIERLLRTRLGGVRQALNDHLDGIEHRLTALEDTKPREPGGDAQ